MNHLLKPAVPLAMLNHGDDKTCGAASSSAAVGSAGHRRRGLADLLPRAASSLVLAAAALVAVWRGGALFAAIWFIASLAVGWEWQNLIGAARLRLRVVVLAAALALAAYFAAYGDLAVACGVLALAGLLTGLAAGRTRRLWALAGVLYAGALIVSVNALYASPVLGSTAIFWLFATVWSTDVFAYFGGRLIGGPKLWPQISPSKTWSGTLSGVLAGALIGAVIGACTLGDARIALPVFALGLVTAVVAQGGDLVESVVKRRFGVKDFQRIDPWPWRFYGPARRFSRRRDLRRPVWGAAWSFGRSPGLVRLALGRALVGRAALATAALIDLRADFRRIQAFLSRRSRLRWSRPGETPETARKIPARDVLKARRFAVNLNPLLRCNSVVTAIAISSAFLKPAQRWGAMEKLFQLRQAPAGDVEARSVVLLGATGSIGASTAEIIKGSCGAFTVAAVAGGHDGRALARRRA